MRSLLWLIVLALLLAACTSSSTPSANVTAPVPPAPTYTSLPTYTPQPTYTPYPTYTALSQSGSPTKLPAATATLPAQPATPTRAPTITRTPVPCRAPYTTRLHIGEQAKVQNAANLNVRSQPTTSGRILGRITSGEIVDLLDGPACGNSMLWWYVRSTSSGLTGWSAEAANGVWWLASYTGGPGCVSTTERVTFPSGGTNAKIIATLSAGCTKSYVLRINAGQNLGISVTGYDNPGLESLTVKNPAKATLSPGGAAGTWWYDCATTGDYTITISGTGRVEFDVQVPPL